ncbi:MAG: peptidylprolyl isomerase [Amphiplicatus sp.]
MKTPDGQEFEAKRERAAGAVLFRLARGAVGFVWRLVVAAARGAGKLVATTWRLAAALDSALWRGAKLGASLAWRSLVAIVLVMASAFEDLAGWLPSRAGRAYAAISGVFLIIAALWIIDELRFAPAEFDAGGEGRPPVDLDDPILARIEGRYVHLSEVAAAALASGALREGETLTAKAAFDRELVEAYVEQRLLARAALDEGLHRQTAVTRQLGAARDRILAAAYMEERLAETVTDDAVARLYRAQSDITRLGDEVRARHIVVETGAEAEEILAQLKAGASFEDLARRRSLDRSTAMIGGDLGYFTRDTREATLAAAAFSTPVGDYAPIFATEFGWHVLEVLDRRRSAGVPLAAVEDGIRRFLTRRTIDATLAALKKDHDVVYYPAEPTPAAPVGALRPGGEPGS